LGQNGTGDRVIGNPHSNGAWVIGIHRGWNAIASWQYQRQGSGEMLLRYLLPNLTFFPATCNIAPQILYLPCHQNQRLIQTALFDSKEQIGAIGAGCQGWHRICWEADYVLAGANSRDIDRKGNLWHSPNCGRHLSRELLFFYPKQ
jgi:hypothetical protein